MRWNTSKIRHSSLIPSQIYQNQSGIEFLVDLWLFRLCLSNNILAVLISAIINPCENVSYISCKTSIICMYILWSFICTFTFAGSFWKERLDQRNLYLVIQKRATQIDQYLGSQTKPHNKSAGLMHQHHPPRESPVVLGWQQHLKRKPRAAAKGVLFL